MNNIISTLFFIISGFFVYIIGFIAFIDLSGHDSQKFVSIGIMCLLFVIFHAIGLSIFKGRSWKLPTGITLVVGALFNLMIIVSLLSIKGSPEIVSIIDASSLDAFNDYSSGFIVMAIQFGAGIFLTLSSRENS